MRASSTELESIPTESHASRFFQRVDTRLARASVGFAVAGACLAVLVIWFASGEDAELESVFVMVTAAITLVMLFVLHHNQRRSISSLQIKLDELVRAIPEADDRYVRIQAADDEEIFDLEREHVDHHEAVRQGRPDR